jgi:hypothetical protein
MDRVTVFVGNQIDREIDWLAAKFTRYFRDRLTTHKCLLWTVTSQRREKQECRLINIDQFEKSTFKTAVCHTTEHQLSQGF